MEEFERKKIKIFLKSGKIFTLEDVEQTESTVSGRDKFNEFVEISRSSIDLIQTISGTNYVN